MNVEIGMRNEEKKDGETGGTRDGVRERLEDRKVGRRGGESEGGIENAESFDFGQPWRDGLNL